MAKANRVAKSKDDLRREFAEQLQLLRFSCETFDKGFEASAKHIALVLRVLLHLHGRSRALMDQLGYRSGKFISTARPINPRNLATDYPLLVMRVSGGGLTWLPLISMEDSISPPRAMPFSDWWLEPILKDVQGRKFSRLTLVQHVADTDGGAHVDPELDEAYMDLSRNNSLGLTFTRDNSPPKNRPELACLRQIAHEVLSTIHQFVPEFSDAARPVKLAFPHSDFGAFES